MPSSTDDPVRLLLRAARDGLLEYHGHTVGELYEVGIAGESRQVHADVVPGLVEQLRAVNRLALSVPAEVLWQVFPDTGSFRISVDGFVELVEAPLVVDWVDGYLAGHARGGQAHAGADTFGEIRELLERPGLLDRARLVILGLMYGDPDRETSTQQLADMVGVTKKTLIGALAFGKPLRTDLADEMVAALGHQWRVSDGPAAGDLAGSDAFPVVEHPGITRLRWIGAAAAAGLLRYVGTASPNRARWSPAYRLAVGAMTYTVPAGALEGWLRGLESWHEQPSAAGRKRKPRRAKVRAG